MPSDADTTTDPTAESGDGTARDEARSVLLEAMTADLGDAIVGTHLVPGDDLWVRVTTDAWAELAGYLRDGQRFRFFNWLSAIDWLPSPFGRSLDSAVDRALGETAEESEAAVMASGVAGGETRFQVLARVHSLATRVGITVKVDVPDDDLRVASWTSVFPGAEWHEREAWEMFGISFTGHPGLRHLYLPGEFEGHPLRKDYPLLARLIKPWPGIVDVEPMPTPEGVTDEDAATDEAAADGGAA